jgi:hypothetical protein
LLQTHIITAQVGNISVLEADVLQVGHWSVIIINLWAT